ncbi:MAG: hypothetical protein HZB39_16570 [Planctomycetes bacterium]|nr:hypothetical protein [Planctomycetota bacterium]
MSPLLLPTAPRRPTFAAVARLPGHALALVVAALLLPLVAVIALHLEGIDVFGQEDDALFAERANATGRVVTTATFTPRFLAPVVSVEFDFTDPTGEPRRGRSFATHAEAPGTGEAVVVEFTPADPTVARVRGTRRNPFEPALSRFVAFGVLPCLLILMLALRDHAHRRALLVGGREAPVEFLERTPAARRERWRYRFRDERGAFHAHVIAVPAGKSFAGRLRDDPGSVRVVHDPARPRRHRLVLASDFRA